MLPALPIGLGRHARQLARYVLALCELAHVGRPRLGPFVCDGRFRDVVDDEALDLVAYLCGAEVEPAHDAQNVVVTPGELEEPLGLGHHLPRLHGDRAVEADRLEKRRKILRHKVASQRIGVVAHPRVFLRIVDPEVLVRVDASHATSPSNGRLRSILKTNAWSHGFFAGVSIFIACSSWSNHHRSSPSAPSIVTRATSSG